ncbi:AAA family ATPase [Nocardia sp. NPDC088792]|uniref:helix-turn-helix transcriptional regulator n=1 Tax=Nocardia sp. NPDC088792 TaxID=3364332 RepID=UPI00382DE44B
MSGQIVELCGREPEQQAITALLTAARAGGSGALVVRGEPGIGKTSLLEYAAATAGEMRLLRGTGIEVEAELPFAGLQLLLRPALVCLDALPGPQRAALATALGLAAGAASEPMLVGLGVLSLLTEYADRTGALVVIDDAQWLDRASQDALLFAARRLQADGVVILFAARDGEGSFPAPGIPEQRLAGLSLEASATLLQGRSISPSVRYRLLAEARGNPLALLELPVAVAVAAERSVDLGVGSLPLTDLLRAAFHGQVSRLPDATRTLLLVLATDETGELGVLLRAAEPLGASIDDLSPAEAAGLLHRGEGSGATVDFRHPLIRAAVYQGAPLAQRLAAHRALAAALDAPEHADRHAWHLAAAATGPDEQTANVLEHTAVRARERGGHKAATAAYDRAARLSVEVEAKTRREALAAQSALEAGELEHADRLAERASGREIAEPLRAGLAQVRALARFWQGAFPEAHRLLIDAAYPIAGSAPEQAAGMLLQALHTAWYLGEAQLSEVLERIAGLEFPPAHPMTPATEYVGRLLYRGTAEPISLAGTLAEIRARGEVSDQVLVMLCGVALARGQDGEAYALASAQIARHRAAGAAGRLPTVLFFAAETDIFTGRLRNAQTTVAEARELARDTGQQQWVHQLASVQAYLDALAGDADACRQHADIGLAGDTPGSMAPGAPWAHWSLGLLELGLGRAEAALSRFDRLTRDPMRHHVCATHSVPDLVEAAVRLGVPERAAVAFTRFEQWAQSVREPWADALVLRCAALLDDDGAEKLYLRALQTHDRDGRPIEYARTALLFGEWLRRGRRKAEARTHLNDALEVFERLGMQPWSQRTRNELTATGATDDSARPAPAALSGLTPQELQIVRLAAQGLSNRDIAAQLFLSHRTVGYHLYKAYPKLCVTSRGELKDVAAQFE